MLIIASLFLFFCVELLGLGFISFSSCVRVWFSFVFPIRVESLFLFLFRVHNRKYQKHSLFELIPISIRIPVCYRARHRFAKFSAAAAILGQFGVLVLLVPGTVLVILLPRDHHSTLARARCPLRHQNAQFRCRAGRVLIHSLP